MGCERRQLNTSTDSELRRWRDHPSLAGSVVMLLIGWAYLPLLTVRYTVRDTLPYKTWLALWGLIAICNIPVFNSVRRRNASNPTAMSTSLMLVLFLLPVGLIVLVLLLVLHCANFSFITGSSAGCSRPSSLTLGWLGLAVGTALLIATAAYVVYGRVPDSASTEQ